MPLIRPLVGKPMKHEGRTITVRHMGPDVIAYVDDIELNGFYLDAEAARAAGVRHIDAEIKAKEKK